MRIDLTQARYPFAKGGYESYYLTAHHPTEPLAVWIRCTVTQAPGKEPVGHRWVTLFTPDGPVATRTEGPLSKEAGWIRVGDATFLDGVAGGTAGDATWELRFAALDAPLLYLPSESMYRRGFPKTKPVSLAPSASFTGSLIVGERHVDVRNWTGMVGHNWGSEHADRWIWVHAGFDRESWLDVVAARIKIGPLRTPWIANGAISIRGGRQQLGGLFRRSAIDASATGATLRLRGSPHKVRVEATVTAPANRFVRWDYPHPREASASDVVHCSNASIDVTTVSRYGEPIRLRSEFGASYELGVSGHR